MQTIKFALKTFLETVAITFVLLTGSVWFLFLLWWVSR